MKEKRGITTVRDRNTSGSKHCTTIIRQVLLYPLGSYKIYTRASEQDFLYSTSFFPLFFFFFVYSLTISYAFLLGTIKLTETRLFNYCTYLKKVNK